MDFRHLIWLLLGLVVGCASTDRDLMPESDAETSAAGAAMVDFSIRKPMYLRRPSGTFEFYYKHCAVSGDESPIGVNAWECNGPFY